MFDFGDGIFPSITPHASNYLVLILIVDGAILDIEYLISFNKSSSNFLIGLSHDKNDLRIAALQCIHVHGPGNIESIWNRSFVDLNVPDGRKISHRPLCIKHSLGNLSCWSNLALTWRSILGKTFGPGCGIVVLELGLDLAHPGTNPRSVMCPSGSSWASHYQPHLPQRGQKEEIHYSEHLGGVGYKNLKNMFQEWMHVVLLFRL